MKTVAFIGGSGTGKSYRASWLAKEGKIEFIIDDGLLIYRNQIVAGKSAKSEPTKIASIRRALFTDSDHARQVRDALEKYNAEAVLVLGTSDQMVENIREKLELQPYQYKIYIEDVATESDIAKAKHIRQTMGKHVIPVPTFEVKKHFTGYVIDSVKVFFGFGKGKVYESTKTVVRPTFSYLGDYVISDQVIVDLSQHAVESLPEIQSVIKTTVRQIETGIYINMDINLNYLQGMFREEYKFEDLSRKVQDLIKHEVEKYTLLVVENVNITVRTITLNKK